MNRRHFLVTAAAASLAPRVLLAQTTTTAPATTRAAEDVDWHDARDLGIFGRAFDDVASPFDRLPARAKGVVRDAVWNLSRHSAGLSLRFETDARTIHVRYTLTNADLAMAHMPATGVSGVDLYARPDDGGAWRWCGTAFPKAQDVEVALARNLPPGRRAFVMYLPLYNGLKSLSVGVPRGASVAKSPPPPGKPIVWYGTSITQGACASRPGLAFTNILSRRLDRTIHNLGFSGNGTTEIEVGRFLNEIDAGAFVIDTMANTAQHLVYDRVVALVRLFRDAHPTTPILVLDDRAWDAGPLAPEMASVIRGRRGELRRAVEALADVPGVTHVPDAPFLGTDGEATVDGSHPNDLGMMRYADALEPTFRKLLV